jgi:hypothetical protein
MIPITYGHMLTSVIIKKARGFFFVFVQLGVTDFGEKVK